MAGMGLSPGDPSSFSRPGNSNCFRLFYNMKFGRVRLTLSLNLTGIRNFIRAAVCIVRERLVVFIVVINSKEQSP
jgi:hypothetical protein